MPEKIIRDPVHDVIAFRLEQPTEALLYQLLNAAEFQRLRRIRQLGMASFAYPGADHSRYSHSLGVMETARKILSQLKTAFNIDPEQEKVCLVGALLHDLGHGPFSHVFERVSGIHHERLTQRVIMDPGSEVHRILIKHDKLMPERVLALLSGSAEPSFFGDILSSQLDADRLDYLLRDNHMTGSRYGDFDLTWLLHAFTIDPQSNRLAISIKGVSAVEAYLQARYHMYRNVYFHKVVRSGEGMLKLALQRAKRLAVQGRLTWAREEDALRKALLGQMLDVEEFLQLDDISLLHCFKLWADEDEPVLAGLCRGLLYRKLFKTIDLSRFSERAERDAAVQKVADAITEAGGEAAYEMFYDEPADTSSDAAGILVKDDSGNLRPIAGISPLVEAMNRQLWFCRLHIAPAWRELAERVIASD